MWEATRPVSERLVTLLDPRPGEAVLDVAGGVGETGFLALERLAPGGRLVSTDGAAEMVEAARRRAAELALGDVTFAVADAQELPFETGRFDGLLCRFGVMLVPEPARAFAEIARVLRPGGRAALAVWADAERNEWATAGGRAALALGLLERPDPDAPGPFRLAAPERLRGLVAGAGLAAAVEEEVAVEWRYASMEAWWQASLDLSRSLRALLAGLSPRDAEAVRAGAFERLRPHQAPDGSLAIPGLARVVLVRR